MTKVEIIDAAFKVWGRNFYRKTSLSQLANELGVSKPALYRHFENKQALIDAMIGRFFDDFAASIRMDYEQALGASEADEGIFAIIRSIAGFYGRNVYDFVFSLINVYDRKSAGRIAAQELKSRGVDMETLYIIMKKKYSTETMIGLIFPTLIFFMAHFHKAKQSFENPPSGKEIEKIISDINKSIESFFDGKSEFTPILTVTLVNVPLGQGIDVFSIFVRIFSAILNAPFISVIGSKTANSSPPHRAARSVDRKRDFRNKFATIFNAKSPC